MNSIDYIGYRLEHLWQSLKLLLKKHSGGAPIRGPTLGRPLTFSSRAPSPTSAAIRGPTLGRAPAFSSRAPSPTGAWGGPYSTVSAVFVRTLVWIHSVLLLHRQIKQHRC